MIAACDLKHAARVGENAFLDVLDPGPVHAHRHLVLGFARHRARMTSDALAIIDYEAVFHPRSLDPKQLIIRGLGRKRGSRCWGQTSCHSYKIVILSEAKDPYAAENVYRE